MLDPHLVVPIDLDACPLADCAMSASSLTWWADGQLRRSAPSRMTHWSVGRHGSSLRLTAIDRLGSSILGATGRTAGPYMGRDLAPSRLEASYGCPVKILPIRA